MNEGETFGTATGGAMPPQNGNSFDRPTGVISSGATGVAGAAGIGTVGAIAGTIAGAANGAAAPMPNTALSTGVAPTTDISAETGNIPTISTAGVSNSSRFFGGRSRFSRHNAANAVSSQQANYAAAQNIAANPNTPQFFSDAVVASTPVPPAPKRKSKKGLFIGIGAVVVVAVVAVVAGVLVFRNNKIANGDSGSLEDAVNKYLSYIYGEQEEGYGDLDIVAEDDYEKYNITNKMESRNEVASREYYSEVSATLDDISTLIGSTNLLEENKAILGNVLERDKDILTIYYYVASSLYVEESGECAPTYIETRINELKNKKDELLRINNAGTPYYTTIELLERRLKKGKIYDKYGCLQTGKLDNSCVNNIDEREFSDIKDSDALVKVLKKEMLYYKNKIFYDAAKMYSLVVGDSDNA